VKKIIIDTDPGIDDAVAIMFALGSRHFDLKAITTVSGNLTADRCSVNARKVLELLDVHHVPVARGMQKPLVRPYPKDPFSHGDNGLGNLELPDPSLPEDPRFAPDLIVDIVNEHAGDISILGIAPLTNVALALMKDPQLPRKVSELIVVAGTYGFDSAGSLRATGDNPVSEWNVYVDPEAADMVFRAGFNLTAIGLDVATQDSITLSSAHRAVVRASPRKTAWFLSGIVDFLEARGFRSYCALIDSLAVAASLDPTLLSTERLRVGVETSGAITRGQTVVDRRQHFAWAHLPEIKAASAIDANRFLDHLLEAII
jgi:purine nucleosidase/pyrimidine-specific ribonucleoside hydrolase